MATAFYLKGLNKIISGNVDWINDTIKLALVTSTYTPNYATHEFFSDVTNELSGYTNPTLTCTIVEDSANDRIELEIADLTISGITSGQTVGGLVIYKDTGVAGTSPLIGATTGLNTLANGGDIDVSFDTEGFLAINRTTA